MRARAEALQRRSASEAQRIAIGRVEWEQRTQRADRRTRIERLRRDLAALEGERVTREASIARLRFEIEKRRRAPVAGRLGEVTVLRPGAMIREGDHLGTIVPPAT